MTDNLIKKNYIRMLEKSWQDYNFAQMKDIQTPSEKTEFEKKYYLRVASIFFSHYIRDILEKRDYCQNEVKIIALADSTKHPMNGLRKQHRIFEGIKFSHLKTFTGLSAAFLRIKNHNRLPSLQDNEDQLHNPNQALFELYKKHVK